MIYLLPAQLLPYKTSFEPGYLLVLVIAVIGIASLRAYNRYRENEILKAKKSAKKAAATDQRQGGQSHPTTIVAQHPDKKELKQISLYFSLTDVQSDFFARLCAKHHILSPAKLFHDRLQLENLFTNAFAELQAVHPPTKESERDKTILFTIREAIENRKRSGKPISSTRLLEQGQTFTFITKADEHYPSSLVENMHNGLLCQVPRDSFDNELRLPIWSKVRVLFYTSGGQSYQFNTRIQKYESATNVTRVLLAHSDAIEALPNRKHDRKSFRTKCTISLVRVANVVRGRQTEHKFFPSAKLSDGIMMDISVGGCSIQTATVPSVGEYLQLQCILHGTIEETIIGKVIKANPVDAHGLAVIHVQFAKMPRATMNRIFSYIYNYGEHNK